MENKFIRAEEVAQELSVSKPYAYKLIRQLNEELKAKGFITITGRVNRQYFYERLYGAGNPQRDTTMSCSAALHHNKTKTNYHIHLIFSERKMLEQPEVKIATRNMFYDEQGKHRRTKKEILDE